MKKSFIYAVFILIPSLSFCMAKEGESLQTLDELIASSERQLLIQKQLRSLVEEFQKQQDAFQHTIDESPATKELALKMVQTASQILQMADENHLTHLFTPFFVEELKFFAATSKKKAR